MPEEQNQDQAKTAEEKKPDAPVVPPLTEDETEKLRKALLRHCYTDTYDFLGRKFQLSTLTGKGRKQWMELQVAAKARIFTGLKEKIKRDPTDVELSSILEIETGIMYCALQITAINDEPVTYDQAVLEAEALSPVEMSTLVQFVEQNNVTFRDLVTRSMVNNANLKKS